MTTGRIKQGTVTAVRVPPWVPEGYRDISSYFLLILSAHSQTCRPAQQVLGDARTRLLSEIVWLGGLRPGLWIADCMRLVRRAGCRIGSRPKADGRDVDMRVNHFAGRRTARSSPLSLVLHKYQMNRREPRRERAASRGRSGTTRWSAEGRHVSALDHHQVIGVYSCFKEGRNYLG